MTALPTVLIVEDEVLIIMMMESVFRDEGFDVISTSLVSEALDILGNVTKVALLFTDVRLPGPVNGWQLGELAKELRPGMPVIYTSGYSDVPPPKIDPSCFFMKPYSVDAVVHAAKRITIAV